MSRGDVRDRLGGREYGRARIGLGAEQPALLGGPEAERDGAVRARPGLERARDLEQPGNAQPIVVCARSDRAVRALAVRVPVRAVHDHLVGARAARQLREDVVACYRRVGDGEIDGERRPRQRHWPKIRPSGGDAQRREVEPGAPKHRGGRLALDPALKRHSPTGTRDVVILAARRGDGAPGIARPGSVVDDQRRHRAPSRRFFVFVGPTTVIGHAPATEPARHRLARPGLEIGIVDQEHRDLAGEVDALEVVPPAFGRVDAITDKHHLRAGDHDAVDRSHGAEVHVAPLRQRHRAPIRPHAGRPVTDLGSHQSNVLSPRAAGAGRFETERL